MPADVGKEDKGEEILTMVITLLVPRVASKTTW